MVGSPETGPKRNHLSDRLDDEPVEDNFPFENTPLSVPFGKSINISANCHMVEALIWSAQ